MTTNILATNHDASVYPAGLVVQIWGNAALPLILKGRGALIGLAPSGSQPPSAAQMARLYAVEFAGHNVALGGGGVRDATRQMSESGAVVLQFQSDADAITYAQQFFPQATTQGAAS